jgi:DNA replication protein DnaC
MSGQKKRNQNQGNTNQHPESSKPSEAARKLRGEARRAAIDFNIQQAGLNQPLYKLMLAGKFEPTQEQERAVKILGEFIHSPSRNIALTGPVGTGKTHLAVRAASELSAQVRSGPRWDGDEHFWPIHTVRFISAPRTLDTLRAQYQDSSASSDRLEQLFVKPGILFLDDFDKVKVTEWSIERLWIILDERIVKIRPTVITSNLKIEGINNKYGEAIASRIANKCRLIELTGKDQRVTGA